MSIHVIDKLSEQRSHQLRELLRFLLAYRVGAHEVLGYQSLKVHDRLSYLYLATRRWHWVFEKVKQDVGDVVGVVVDVVFEDHVGDKLRIQVPIPPLQKHVRSLVIQNIVRRLTRWYSSLDHFLPDVEIFLVDLNENLLVNFRSFLCTLRSRSDPAFQRLHLCLCFLFLFPLACWSYTFRSCR